MTLLNSPVELQSDAKRALLAERLRRATESRGESLSFAQQRLWFINQLEPNSALYNLPLAMRLRGALNQTALQQALTSLACRHEILRTHFICTDGHPVQVVDETPSLAIVFHDAAVPGNSDPVEVARRIFREEVNRPFDISAAPPVRASLIRLKPDEHWFVYNMHHIISDEWSLRIIFEELGELYSAGVSGRAPDLPELPIQYSDYAAWQRDWFQNGVLKEQVAYWTRQLSGSPPVLELPIDHPRAAVPSFRGRIVSRELPGELVSALKRLGETHEATLFMVMAAAFQTLLHRYTMQQDIVIGSPVAGRNKLETERLVGFFVNTIMLRADLGGNPSFTELLRRVRESTLGAYTHQDLPFEKLVEVLRPDRTLSHMPFTRIMFLLQNGITQNSAWADLEVEFLEAESETAKFELTLAVQETDNGLTTRAEYNRDLFDHTSIERMLEHFEVLLQGIAEKPHARLSELPLLTQRERRQLLVEWNDTKADYPREKCVHELFESQSEQTPEATAIVFGQASMTYRELNERANNLARRLESRLEGEECLVGLCLEPSAELIVGMLAILKAGAAYVPLDPAYPKQRLAFMLKDSRAPVVLTHRRLLARMPRRYRGTICIDSHETIAGGAKGNVPGRGSAEQVAYVMYTSGSTGQPKGVAVPHRAISRLVLNTNYVRLGNDDRVAQISSPSFDAATFEIWGALLNGAQLVGIGKNLAVSPKDFARELCDKNITTLFVTAALFNQVVAEIPNAFAGVRNVVFGGEAGDPKSVRTVLKNGPPQHLINGYGPTENTTFSACCEINALDDDAITVPIGKPISNSQCYVLDRYLNPLPVGVPGELYVGGDGLALGYWRRPELSAQKFVANPFSDEPDARLYRTGDLARWRPDGVLECLGRIDRQVKLRGFRIELGEIEAVLSAHPAVRECAVVMDDARSCKRLVAYVVPNGRRAPALRELRRHLEEKLPDYMIPSAYVPLDALPLTANGKVDFKALQFPEASRPTMERKCASPRDAVELKLAQIWETVLDVRPIGIEDKFFEVGGHSLLAVRLIAQIERTFGRRLQLATIFQAQTIEQLAAILREDIREGSALAGTSLVEIQSQGSRRPLFLVHGAGGGMFWGYVNLSRRLGHSQPVYGLRSRGLDGREEFGSIEEMAAQYVKDIRVLQPKGPYRIGGYCFGGNVAYEMARQLEAQGETVAMLALLNCAPPNSRYSRIHFNPLWALRFLKNLCYWTNYFWHWTPQQRREFFRWKKEMLQRHLGRLVTRGPEKFTKIYAGDLVDLSSYTEEQRRLWEKHIEALANYRPGPYSGSIHLFRSPGHPLLCSFDADYGWSEWVRGRIHISVVPGVHEKILEEPCVRALAEELDKFLCDDRSQEEHFWPGSAAENSRNGRNPFHYSARNGNGHEPLSQRKSHNTITRSDSVELSGRNRTAKLPELTAYNPTQSPAPVEAIDGARLSNEAGDSSLDFNYAREFEAQATRTPQAVALRFGNSELNYGQLNERANRLAHYLQTLGVGPEILVAVCLKRSLELPVAILSVLKAGGAYLPLDRSYPNERLEYILSDSGARVLLTDAEMSPRFATSEVRVCCIDEPKCSEAIEACSAENPECRAGLDNLAYLIYTSGSTGGPKGVEITHRSLLNHNFAIARAFELQPGDRVLQFNAFSFDVSIEEMFPSWLRGCAVVLRPDPAPLSIAQFLNFVRQERLAVLNLPTAYWHELVEHVEKESLPECVRLVVIGGEKASDAAWREWKARIGPGVALINAYGPTETTITATLHVARAEDESLPIGRPIENTRTVILNSNLEPVDAGTPGELFIGGVGVARGYRNRPELTNERFISKTLKDLPTSRWYRTGDLARMQSDGTIEFIGRVDDQVKIRGFRIEPGEIENVLRSHPNIKTAVVLAREDIPGKKRLVAYFVLRRETNITVNDLIHFLKERLPSYMVPIFVRLDAIPLTPAGKVDRAALPAPGDARPELSQKYVAPRTPVEEVIADIWCEVLGLNRVGVHDNFFDLGGNSLLAMKVISRIRDALQIEVPLAGLFSFPTVAALAERPPEASSHSQPVLPVSAVSRGERLPLSDAQQRIWFLDQFEPQQAAYNIRTALRVRGHLNVGALEDSLTALARRHDALRAVFPAEDGLPIQIICEPKGVQVVQVDLRGVPESEREGQMLAIAKREGQKSYVMSSPMLRAVLIRLAEGDYLLLLITHEIACDAKSVRVLFEELATLYDAQCGCQPDLPPLQLNYSDAIRNAALSADLESAQLNFWKQKLHGAPALLDLPADRARPAHFSDAGARREVVISKALTCELEKLADHECCGLQVVLLAAFQTLLARYTCTDDIVVGSIASKRSQPRLQRVIGKFDDFIVFRSDLSGNPSFEELLRRVKQTVSEALANAAVPFAKVLDALRPSRNAGYTPVFQVMFVFDEPLAPVESGGVRFMPVEIDHETAKLDLKLHLGNTPEGLAGYVEYSTALFDADRISRLVEHLGTLLENIVLNPDRQISTLPLMSSDESRRVLVEWNATEKEYSRTATLASLFQAQVQRSPDAIALIAGNERFSYQELNKRANQLAHHLGTLGVKPGVLVGVCIERSWRMLVAILGVLKAGGAYVPMDPAYPRERLAFILRDTKAPVLLTQESLRNLLETEGARTVCLDSDWPQIESICADNPFSGVESDDLAYVIYTSGSTGQPKGVAIEHRSAVALMHWARDVFAPEELAGVLAATSICFDLSVFEMFVPLSWGGTVILAENALALLGLAALHEVTLINTVPSAIRELLRVKGIPSSVRVVNLAGEPLSTALADQIYSETSVQKVYDLYGPSETTTYSTFALRERGQPPTIGRPLANEQVFILDANFQPMPIGVPGEIFIGGDGLARGYLNRTELTAEKFVPSPFKPGVRLYRTGDLARWRADGNLEFLGRIDHQVKIRGYRIELGEVESVVRKHPDVREAVVVAKEDPSGSKRLIAYTSLRAGATSGTDALRRFCKERLPEFMVPSVFMILESLPLTPNGKVDRKALPEPEQQRGGNVEFVAPRTAVEEQLTAIWREVLRVEQPGVRDNFFELGGHSLLAIQVISRVREEMRVELPLFSLFEAPTIERLAKGLASGQWTQEQLPVLPLQPMPREGNVPVSFVQERLWFLDQLEPGGCAYNVPLALRLQGKLDCAALQRAFDEIVRRHEALRTTFLYNESELTQRISEPKPVNVEHTDFASIAQEQRETRVQEWVNAEARKPFDLATGPLIRVGLGRISDNDHALVVVMHHTASDGWSQAILFQELEALYGAFAAGKPVPTLPELCLQPTDFALWKRRWMHGAVLEKELSFWKEKLKGAPPAIKLPVDGNEEGATGRAKRRALKLPAGTAREITSFSQRESATPFTVLLTALAITLEKWTSQRDMVLGTVIAGRNHREIENVIGCFMNFLPIRTTIRGDETGRELLHKVKASVLAAQTHQECPFEKIVEAVNPERRLNQNPLYNVALLLQNFPSEMLRIPNVQISPVQVDLQSALLDLRFEAELNGHGFSLICEYREDLFDGETIEHLLASYQTVLEALVKTPDAKLGDFRITERLVEQAASARVVKGQETLIVAGTFTAEPVEESLRYWASELEIEAHIEFAPFNQVFQQLLDPTSAIATNVRGVNVLLIRLEDWFEDRSVEPDQLKRVGEEFNSALKSAASRSAAPFIVVLCPPSLRIITNAVAKDIFEEAERAIASELGKLSSVHVVTSRDLMELYPVSDYYDASGDELGRVAYTPVFFTALGTMVMRKFHALRQTPHKVIVLDCDQTLWSGVCGEDGAKGICLDEPRKALQEFMREQHAAGMLLAVCSKNNEEDVREVFAQRLEMPLRHEHFAAWRTNWNPKSQNLRSIAEELNLGLESFIFVDDNPVECAEVEANCPEVLVLQLPENPGEIPQFLKHCWAFDHLMTTAEDRARNQAYRQNRAREEFLNKSMSLADFVAGLNLKVDIHSATPEELPRVAQLTQRTNQFNCTTIRRTEADLLKLGSDSSILTVAVSDRFGDYGLVGVVILEPRERSLDVETFLLSCRVLGRGVEHAMLARLGKLAFGQKRDWVDVHFHPSPKNKPAFDFLESIGSSFRQALNGGYIYRFPAEFAATVVFKPQAAAQSPPVQHAPERADASKRMERPKNFKRCRAIAREANDVLKIHRTVEGKVSIRSAVREGFISPSTETEKKICTIWEKLLRVERVGLGENFFDLGGHSLMAVRLFAELQRHFGRKLPLVTIFQAPTVEQLAQVIDEQKSVGSRSPLVAVQPNGSRPPLFLVHGAGGDVLWGYANLAKHINPDQPIYGIKSRGQIGLEEFERIDEMARYYVKELRSFQPSGPYYLGGYCLGGNVAYEMARQLYVQGERVALVALLDSFPANAGYERMQWWRRNYPIRFARNFRHWLRDFAELKPEDRRRFIGRKLRAASRKLVRKSSRVNGRKEVDLEDVIDPGHFPEHELKFWKIHLDALENHFEQPYAGAVTLIRTRGQPLFCSLEEDFCWSKLARGGVKVFQIPGSHENIFMEPHVKALASVLESCLGEKNLRTEPELEKATVAA